MNGASRSILLQALFLVFLSNAMIAHARTPSGGYFWFDSWLEFYVRKGDSVEKVRASLRHIHSSIDFNGGGVSAADVLIQEQTNAARLRAAQLREWLHQDLNGDGVVTRRELEIYFPRKEGRSYSQMSIGETRSPTERIRRQNYAIRQALKFDRNNDGVVALDEALDWVKKNPNRIWASKSRVSYAIPMSLDRNADGTVSIEEFDAALNAAIARLDKDGNGEFSSNEIIALGRTVGKRRRVFRTELNARESAIHNQRRKELCDFPKVPPSARVILVGTIGGQALSTISLGGEDNVVTVANAVIEPGPDKLYVVIASRLGVIWRFTGVVDRLAHLVVTAQTLDVNSIPSVGVVGVPADRVHIPNGHSCINHFTSTAEKYKEGATTSLRRLIGRGADIVAADKVVGTVRLPAASFDRSATYADAIPLPETGSGTPLWKKMLVFNPGGLVALDPATIVSRTIANPYKMLPREAGLARLLESGALELLSDSKQESSDESARAPRAGNAPDARRRTAQLKDKRPHSRFLVAKSMRFPAGLTGDHVVKFVLKEGVPRPLGWPGHSRILE
jgi:hypothetical protein